MQGENSLFLRPCLFFDLAGDFSYSYDLARCLARHDRDDLNDTSSGNRKSNDDDGSGSSSNSSSRRVRLTATGLDSYGALVTKYKDAPFLLQRLRKISLSGGAVVVRHQVDAVVVVAAPGSDDSDVVAATTTTTTDTTAAADVVIFNHPHLGVEDAVRHAQFLSHFFHSAVTHWLRRPERSNPAALYLALVVGQWERWRGDAAAERHGLVVLHRSPWRPVPIGDGTTRYFRSRRHQSGRSFASRRRRAGGSEVFCLVRRGAHMADAKDGGDHGPRVPVPPYPFADTDTTDLATASSHEETDMETFACLYCEKRFAEGRSLRNHVRSKHRDEDHKEDDDDDEKDGISSNHHKRRYRTCEECDRTFASHQAWQAHVQAKHTAVHTIVKPDRCQRTVTGTGTVVAATAAAAAATTTGNPIVSTASTTPATSTTTATCPFCDHVAGSRDLLERHLRSFVPDDERDRYGCSFCHKKFREDRARRQHENFCPLRLSPSLHKPRREGRHDTVTQLK